MRIQSSTTSSQWANIRRSIFTFDTSPLTADAVISSGVFSLAGTGVKSDGLSITPNIALVAATPANHNNLVTADYGQLETADLATRITYAGWDETDGNYNDFALNSAGKSNISKIGISKFGVRNGQYDADNSPPSWSSSQASVIQCDFADVAGTATDPKLVITFSFPTGGNPVFFSSGGIGVS